MPPAPPGGLRRRWKGAAARRGAWPADAQIRQLAAALKGCGSPARRSAGGGTDLAAAGRAGPAGRLLVAALEGRGEPAMLSAGGGADPAAARRVGPT